MIILFLSRLFYPHIGGVEKHVLEVGRRLVKKGHEVVVVSESSSRNRYHDLNHDSKKGEGVKGIQVVRIKAGKDNWFKKFKIWWWLWRHRQLIKKADIVHCHDVFFWYLPFRFLYLQKPVYTTFHGYETKFPPSKKAIFVRKISEKLSFGNICVGDYIKKWYGTKPNFATYGGVDVHLGGVEVVASPPSEVSKKLKILFIGRVEEDTGIRIYLEALKILKDKKIDFEFEVCGDGSLKSYVAQYYKVNGFVEDLNSYIKKADFVFTSSYLSILQALALKRLVFAVYSHSLKEDYLRIMPCSSFLVIESDAKKLAGKIEYYLAHPSEEKKMVENAYNCAKNQTWEKVADMYLKLWKT